MLPEKHEPKWTRDPYKTYGITYPLHYEHMTDPDGTQFTRLVKASGEVVIPPYVVRRGESTIAKPTST